jgi:hypothetical protein
VQCSAVQCSAVQCSAVGGDLASRRGEAAEPGTAQPVHKETPAGEDSVHYGAFHHLCHCCPFSLARTYLRACAVGSSGLGSFHRKTTLSWLILRSSSTAVMPAVRPARVAAAVFSHAAWIQVHGALPYPHLAVATRGPDDEEGVGRGGGAGRAGEVLGLTGPVQRQEQEEQGTGHGAGPGRTAAPSSPGTRHGLPPVIKLSFQAGHAGNTRKQGRAPPHP